MAAPIRQGIAVRVAAVRAMGSSAFWPLVVTCLSLGFVAYLVTLGVDGARAHFAGHRGHLDGISCQRTQTKTTPRFECRGSFHPDDGSFPSSQVELGRWYAHDLTGTSIAVRVSATDSSTAYPADGDWLASLLLGPAGLIGLTVVVWRSLAPERSTRSRRRAVAQRPHPPRRS